MSAPTRAMPPSDGQRYDDARVVAERILLARQGIDRRQITAALSESMGTWADYADIYFKSKHQEFWGLEDGAVKRGTFGADQGFGLRAMRGDDTTFAASQHLTPESIMHVARQVRSAHPDNAVAARRVSSATVPSLTCGSLYAGTDPLLSRMPAEKLALLKEIDRYARRRDPRVVGVDASLGATYEVMWVARTDGIEGGDVRPLIKLSVKVQVQFNGRRESAHSGMGGRYGYDALKLSDVHGMIDRIVSAALTKLDARPAPAGTMTVVIGPGWNGVLLHEAVGHGLEGDFNRLKTSAFAGRIGDRVAARGVTIVDDGTIPGARGSLTVDDDGCPTTRTVLIEDGILVGYMQDAVNARLMHTAPTGNGRRESYTVMPMPRMTNTYMEAGSRDPGEIVESVRDGIYVANLDGGQVDIASGRFVFEASEAYLIENGRITAPVKGATIIGNGPEALLQVSMIGHDAALDPGIGVCGKQGQSLPVGVGQPTLRIDGMTVGGTA